MQDNYERVRKQEKRKMRQAMIVIIGVIIGVLLDEIFIGVREKRKEKKQSKSVRTLISLEIDQNLSSLTEFWNKLTNGISSLAFRDQFVKMSIPNWSHNVWKSQTSFMPTALNEDEIKEIWNFHNQLNSITDIHTMLSYMKNKTEKDGVYVGTWPTPQELVARTLSTSYSRFRGDAGIIWAECESVINKLLNHGNPLRPKL